LITVNRAGISEIRCPSERDNSLFAQLKNGRQRQNAAANQPWICGFNILTFLIF
jgi:hypothetical protein